MMARSVAWQRVVSDAISWRQDQALNATIYILRETGPTGFLLKEEGETKNFKVFLGDPHRCTCPVFMKEKDLCKHICWVLLKKFKIPRQNSLTWQLGLVEREINEILRGALVNQDGRPSHGARKYAAAAKEMGLDPESGRAIMQQRDIGKEDVCPICQEELLEKHLPVTFCKFGCGNNVHIKCMKVWAEHQKSQGKDHIECPFCRKDFGPLSLLKQELKNLSQRETRADRMNEHLGTTCKKCHVCPISGKCYKCTTCADYHLCQACFNTPTHTDHNFQFRQKTSQRWRQANRGHGGLLPDAIINNLMTREISDGDYDLLLQLDSGSGPMTSDLTEETIRSFPMERIRNNGPLLAPGQQCRICLRGYEAGQFVRRLPCRHKFHRDCIDDWLLHRRATCPVDGTTFTNQSVQDMNAANRARLKEHQEQLRQRSSEGSVLSSSNRNQTGVHLSDQMTLEIPGIGLARLGGPTTDSTVTFQGLRLNSRSNQSGTQDRTIDGGQNIRLQAQRRNSGSGRNSSGRRARSGSDTSSLTFGDLMVAGIQGQGHSERIISDSDDMTQMLDDMYINMVANDNRRSTPETHNNPYSSAMDENGQENSANVSSAGSERAIVNRNDQRPSLTGPEIGQGQAVPNQTLLFDPEIPRRLANGEISVERPQDRLERSQRRQGQPRKQGHLARQRSLEGQGRDNSQGITISGVGVSDTPERTRTQDHSVPAVATPVSSAPSIPAGYTAGSSQGLEIINGDNASSRKPPSGDGNHRRAARLRSKPLHQPIGQRDRSASRERSMSQDGQSSNQSSDLGSLYIGHEPSSLAGFNCDFLLSSNQSRSSKVVPPRKGSLRRTESDSGPSTTEHPITTDNISLSGTHIQRASTAESQFIDQ